MKYSVVEIGADETHELRMSVLRNGTPSAVVTFDNDGSPSTTHLGIRLDDGLRAISTWITAAYVGRMDSAGFQIRGMAVEPKYAGRGLGSALINAGTERCKSLGAELVWARCRVTAISFYECHGFVCVGSGYIDSTTELPHHDMLKVLD